MSIRRWILYVILILFVVEYEQITPIQEREVFQRVQEGMALKNAGKSPIWIRPGSQFANLESLRETKGSIIPMVWVRQEFIFHFTAQLMIMLPQMDYQTRNKTRQ